MVRWRDFEKLGRRIFAELRPHAAVKWNDHIRGHLSGANRQIDVSIRWEFEGKQYLSIVQAKDHGKPADINEVGEFLSVIQDVKADSGILVCRSGFTATARNYARQSGVSLMNLHDAESANWSLQLTIPILWIELTPEMHVQWVAKLEAGDSFPDAAPKGPLMTPDGGHKRINPVTTFMRYWNSPNANRALDVQHNLISDRPLQLIVEDVNGAEQLRQVEDYRLTYTVKQQTWLGRFQPAACRGLVDYLDSEAFIASYLPISEIPAMRDDDWEEIDDPRSVVVNTHGTIVTTAEIVVLSDGRIEKLDIRYAGPERPATID